MWKKTYKKVIISELPHQNATKLTALLKKLIFTIFFIVISVHCIIMIRFRAFIFYIGKLTSAY